jgi:Mrp family chromosome partitioning ATPase
MTQPDGATTLILRSQRIEPIEPREREPPRRVVPVWASPVDAAILAMLRDGWPDIAAELRVIRHRLEMLRARGMWTFGVTSARVKEGKSTLATQLALVLTEAQRARVLLVEASMHRPAIARLLGFQVPTGLGFSRQIALRMRGGLEPWTVLALGPALHVLAESEAEPGCPDALHSRYFRGAIERLAHAYDWVIVDAPSVLGSGDANVVEEAVDGMIVAARSRASRAVDLRAAIRQLGDRKAVGVVLWDARR